MKFTCEFIVFFKVSAFFADDDGDSGIAFSFDVGCRIFLAAGIPVNVYGILQVFIFGERAFYDRLDSS